MDEKSLSQQVMDSVRAKYAGLADELTKEYKKVLSAELDKAGVKVATFDKEKHEELFEKAIDEYYGAYDPDYYVRSKSLYDALDLKTDDMGFIETEMTRKEINWENAETFSTANEFGRTPGMTVFNTVFYGGYHGGAAKITHDEEIWHPHPSPGTPYWRKPGQIKRPGSRSYTLHRWGQWSKPAFKSKPPFSIYQKYINEYEEGEMVEKIGEVLGEHIVIAKDKLQNQIFPRLHRKFISGQ